MNATASATHACSFEPYSDPQLRKSLPVVSHDSIPKCSNIHYHLFHHSSTPNWKLRGFSYYCTTHLSYCPILFYNLLYLTREMAFLALRYGADACLRSLSNKKPRSSTIQNSSSVLLHISMCFIPRGNRLFYFCYGSQWPRGIRTVKVLVLLYCTCSLFLHKHNKLY